MELITAMHLEAPDHFYEALNADLTAALNIAARFIAKMLGVTTGDRLRLQPSKAPIQHRECRLFELLAVHIGTPSALLVGMVVAYMFSLF